MSKVKVPWQWEAWTLSLLCHGCGCEVPVSELWSSSAVAMPALLRGVRVWGQRGLAGRLLLSEAQLLGKSGRCVLLFILKSFVMIVSV